MIQIAEQSQFQWNHPTIPAHKEKLPATKRAPHLRLVKREREIPEVLLQRDPSAIRQAFPWIAALSDRYYRAEVEGTEHLSDHANLMVSTHNGSISMPDLYCLFVAYFRRFGLETPVYAVAHSVAFKVPVLGPMLRRFGAIDANPENAHTVLREGFPLLVCPGGDEDSLKPFSDRHRISFGRRRGFIRLALQEQVPITPVVSVGAHEVLYVINDGRKTAKSLRLDRIFRIKTAPLSFSFPFGLTIAGVGAIPLPAKIKIRVLPPIFLREPPSAADDPVVVERCFNEVREQMQRSLTDLASTRRRPFFG